MVLKHQNMKNDIKFKETEIGAILENWDVLTIDEISTVVGGGTPSTKNQGNFGFDVPWITPRDLSTHQDRFIATGERGLTSIGLASSSAKLVPAGTVLLTTRAPVGYLAIAKNQLATNQGFRSMITNDRCDGLFLYYLLKHNVQRLIDHASGSTFQELSGSVLKSMKFAFPKLNEQVKIAEILSSLDDKIELNRQMNKTLESIAQTLFKQWFVDFEFPDKNGKPYKSSGGKMVKSELGEIPEGWGIDRLGNITKFLYGKALKEAEREAGEIEVYGSSGLVGYHNENLVKGPGIVVGRKGNVGSIFWVDQDFYPIDTTYYIKTSLSLVYVFYLLARQNFINGDSVVPGLNREQAYSIEICAPSKDVIDRFDEAVSILRKHISINNKETGRLESIRDSLLPQLMSGKVRVWI